MIDKINILFLLFNSKETIFIDHRQKLPHSFFTIHMIELGIRESFYILSSKNFNLEYCDSKLNYNSYFWK